MSRPDLAMMTRPIKHHLSDDLLMAHAAGALPEALSLMVATHVSLCDDCRARLAGYDMLGGVVLADCASPLAEDALDRALARLDRPDPAPTVARPKAQGAFPAPLAAAVGAAPRPCGGAASAWACARPSCPPARAQWPGCCIFLPGWPCPNTATAGLN